MDHNKRARPSDPFHGREVQQRALEHMHAVDEGEVRPYGRISRALAKVLAA
jgi:hypothetical protein